MASSTFGMFSTPNRVVDDLDKYMQIDMQNKFNKSILYVEISRVLGNASGLKVPAAK